jgi:hypothetical protein
VKLAYPDMNLANIDENDLKTDAAKASWREFIKAFEKKLKDFNFGTLLRLNAAEDYTETNTTFGNNKE